ncbi:MAG: cytochrome c-type biogenesis protein [Hyphomonas sp.]
MKHKIAVLAILAVQAAFIATAQTQPPKEYPPEIEAEAREVGQSLRCVVCQNQSIEDSGAPLAADMRQLVRERLQAGDTPNEVRAFMKDRYGNFVLMKPPFQADTLLLWLAPLLFLLASAAGWLIYLRPRTSALTEPAPLSEEEQERLAMLSSQSAGD